jgi:hypothetical protein
MKKTRSLIKGKIYRLYLLVVAIAVATMSLAPLMMGQAEAYGQITNRSLTISSGVPGQTNVTYNFSFALATGTTVQSLSHFDWRLYGSYWL